MTAWEVLQEFVDKHGDGGIDIWTSGDGKVNVDVDFIRGEGDSIEKALLHARDLLEVAAA